MSDGVSARPADVSVKSVRGRRVLSLILAALVMLLVLASFLLYRLAMPPGSPGAEVETGDITWVRSIYGLSDRAEDQFDRTQAAVPAADGSIWVTDSRQRALMRFEPDGRFTGFVNGSQEVPLATPSRFTIGADGRFYVCETALDTVRVLDSEGNEDGSFSVPSPVSVAVSGDRIVVGSVSGFAILDREGTPIRVMGSRGDGDEQFDYVHGVAISPEGTIYVADSFNNRLSAYDRDGERLWMVRTGNPGNNAQMVDGRLTVQEAPDMELQDSQALQLPLGLTLDGAGRIVVADMFECALAVFDAADGTFVAKYGVPGPEDGQFFYPVSVDYDAKRDWFTVADNLNNRVQVVRIPGSADGGLSAATAVVRRSFAAPLRAGLVSLLLFIPALGVWFATQSGRWPGSRRTASTLGS